MHLAKTWALENKMYNVCGKCGALIYAQEIK